MTRGIRVAVLDTGSEQVGRVVDLLTSAGAEVVATAPDVETLMARTADRPPDVVILDAGVDGGQISRVRAVRTGAEPSPLSPREAEVLGLLGTGSHVTAIARRLGLSVHTVRGHVKKILAKLGCHSQLEAVAKAHAHGWIGRGEGVAV